MLTKNDFKKMNDRQLVTVAKTSKNVTIRNIAIEVLLKRYERQLYKNWYRLKSEMNNSDLVNSMQEEYFEEANEAFFTAIQKVDLDRIENDNWKLVGMVNWYLLNVKTKLRKQILAEAKVKSINHMHEVAEDESAAADPDVENAYWEQEGYKDDPSYVIENKEAEKRCEGALPYCKSIWSDSEICILNGLLAHKSKADIASEIGCNTSKIYSMIKKMKGDMKEYLFA